MGTLRGAGAARMIRAGGKRTKGDIPRSWWGAESLTIGAVGKRRSLLDTALLPKLLFTSKTENCVHFALLNVIGSTNRKKKKLMKALNTQFCGFPELAGVSSLGATD